jgi:ABC-2 type transport system ATP-binding protein
MVGSIHDLVHRLTDVDDTILLTTRDLDEAGKPADRIVILAGGRIIAGGSADQPSRQVAGESEIRWTRDGNRYVPSAAAAPPSSASFSGSGATASPSSRSAAPAWRTRT